MYFFCVVCCAIFWHRPTFRSLNIRSFQKFFSSFHFRFCFFLFAHNFFYFWLLLFIPSHSLLHLVPQPSHVHFIHSFTKYTNTCMRFECVFYLAEFSRFYFSSCSFLILSFEWLLKHRPWWIQYIYRKYNTIWISARGQRISQMKFILLAKQRNKNMKIGQRAENKVSKIKIAKKKTNIHIRLYTDERLKIINAIPRSTSNEKAKCQNNKMHNNPYLFFLNA